MPYRPVQPQLVSCPFNPAHRVQEDRLQVHIHRCMKNYPNHVTCPYNVLHKFLNNEALLQHINDCKDNIQNIRTWYEQGTEQKQLLFRENHGDLSEPPVYANRYEVVNPKADEEEW